MLRVMLLFGFLAFFGANGQCIEVDQYLISDSVIKSVDIPLKIDSVIAYDQAWFKNSNGSEVLVIELATDHHRFVTTHFLVDSIAPHQIRHHTSETSPISGRYFKDAITEGYYLTHFSDLATQLSDSLFVSEKGHRLGEAQEYSISKYGNPDTIIQFGAYTKFYWKFEGDILDETISKKCAINSFGYYMTFIYLNGKLVARILIDDIP